MKNTLKLLAKLAFAFGIIAYMIYTDRLDLNVVREGLGQPQYVLPALGLILLGVLLSIYRWGLLMRGQGVELPLSHIIRYGFIGVFFNTTMPGMVSGDLVKAWYVISDREKGQPKTPILTGILFDRIIGLFGLIMVSVAALFLNWGVVWEIKSLHTVAVTNLMLAVGVVAFYVLVMLSGVGPIRKLRESAQVLERNKIGQLILRVFDAWAGYRERPLAIFGALFCAMGTHSCVVLGILLSTKALGDPNIGAFQVFLLAPLGLLGAAIPVAPAGLGVGHVFFAGLFALAGSRLGAEIFTLFITLQILINCIGLIFYIRSPRPAAVREPVASG